MLSTEENQYTALQDHLQQRVRTRVPAQPIRELRTRHGVDLVPPLEQHPATTLPARRFPGLRAGSSKNPHIMGRNIANDCSSLN